ncbi:putative toxin-antitoxin system antitoxin component (TIGR02293 family) [Hoeflea marina]|uniref:Putative toxin-antitoxin system antitoxin component (TIGR02293 family) n=1 Tax=Hoeflea marina TaxID=274592 RepID=A0A317PPU8_9HYPH|nr:antitoxin Xre/MbcA/ParS toxin-binding domain-containing protein [Hoeflea marina]PWW01600.1 putative toxin-antitoxin system antitoxin component (TIGR02293 family) [Hoeflea marina]
MTNAFPKATDSDAVGDLLRRAAPQRQARLESKSIDALKAFGFSMDEIYRLVAPRRTLARRAANNEMLTVVESDSVLRVLRICELARDVFDGWDRAEGWLRDPCPALNGVAPVGLLESESGARLVEDELLRIEHGIFF